MLEYNVPETKELSSVHGFPKEPDLDQNVMIDMKEHWTIGMRLDVIDKNDTTGLGSPARVEEISNRMGAIAFDSGLFEQEISWKKGSSDNKDNTIGYEVLRKAGNERYPWRIGWEQFKDGVTNYSFKDNLCLKIT